MQKIIQAAPNITHLYLTLIVWASDNVSGLCQGLPSMNPTRVVLFDVDYRKSNKNTQFLRDTLEQCISKWKNLAIFELPYRNDTFHSSPSSMAIASALSKAPNLKTLVIPHSHLVSRAPAHLVVIAKNSSLQTSDSNGHYYASSPSVNASLRGLLQTPEEECPETSIDIPIHPNPSLKPVQFSTVSVTEDIWKRILDFAMVLDVENQPLNTRFPYRLGPVLVSKTFAKLALPYLYETLIFRTPFALNDFSAKLTTNPSLGPLVRTLYLDTLAQVNIRPKILPNTKLAFSDLAKFSGPTLTRLEGLQVTKSSGSKPENPFILARFSRIRSLSLVMKASFDTSSTISPSTLATLERLRLSNFDTSLLSILSQLDLPALRHVDFAFGAVGDEGFFDKHGSKLQTVTLSVHQAHRLAIFNRCPAVVHLTLLCGHDLPIPSSFTCAINHMHLEKVSFDTNLRGRGTERKWGVFFQSLNVSTFPALREIQVPCIVWPTTEYVPIL
ncbi:hypothetical protein B0H10DRAFT_2020333 [Mycena sp. CBHHK59/15]|nr:hypothetical protein B0H10DRAFT_2020333 [Mycena sp. CBHHK59/15]